MLQRPYNLSIRGKTVDANEANEVSWSVSGDISTAYKIDILLNSDNSLVWTSNQITSYALKHTIPAYVLTNGIEYKITVTIWNASNETSTSYPDIFQTSSRPAITVDNIGTVNSFSYNFTATYFQAESVSLRNYTVNLYDDKNNLINNSSVKSILPIEHLFSNLQTEQQYYIEFQATSSKGLTGTSGLILFDVFYYRPKLNVNLQAKNIDNAGIELSWYVVQIILKNNNGVFIDNEKIDLINGSMIADEGLEINKDFTLKLWIEQPYMSNVAEQVNLIKLIGENGSIYLQYWDDHRFHLWKEINGLKSHWHSEVVTGINYLVNIQQIADDMNLNASVIS